MNLPPDVVANWHTPAREWSQRMWIAPPDAHFEPAFARALIRELEPRVGTGAAALVREFEQSGAALTAHHVCPTNGPTFCAMDFLACLGRTGPILVLAWSGVAMSNTAASGALCFDAAQLDDLVQRDSVELRRQRAAAEARRRDGVAEQRLSLIPSGLRDALVYECPLPQRVAEVLHSATPELAALLPAPTASESYAAWALRSNERIQRAVLARDNLWYVDLNRVAKHYLLEVLSDSRHPITKLLAAAATSALPGALGRLPWFYARAGAPEHPHVEPLYGDVDRLVERLHADRLCPGLVPVFAALRLLSRIRLLGGVRQLEYLDQIVQGVMHTGALSVDRVDRGVPGGLLTGRLRTAEQRGLYPLDIALGIVERGALPDPETEMGVLWQPIFAGAAPG